MTERIREGVSLAINSAMNAVDADVLREDNVLFRTCGHGVRHPVASLDGRLPTDEQWTLRNHQRSVGPFQMALAECCGCCTEWPKGA